MRNFGRDSQSGFSLLEALIVVTIVGIICAIAFVQFGSASDSFRTQNVARELKVSLERARFDSVKRRPSDPTEMARISILDSRSFSVTLDLGQNGSLDPEDTKIVNFGSGSNVRITGTGLNFPILITFDRRGHTTATDSSGNIVTLLS